MKKTNQIMNKMNVIYAKKNLVLMIKNTITSEIIVVTTKKCRDAARNICNLRYKTPKEIPVVFHTGCNYDYHFIIKELAKEFKIQLECLGENTKKYITFLVPIKKQLDNGEIIIYKIKYIDRFWFVPSLLSSLVDILTEGLHNDKYRDCKYCFEDIWTKDNQLIFNWLERRKSIKKNLIKIYLKDLQIYTNFELEILINLFVIKKSNLSI